jgi:hypothetical protein
MAALEKGREKVARPQPTPRTPVPVQTHGTRKFLAVVVDVVVLLLLIAVGGFLGEMLAGKPTLEIWQDAGSSVKFPSIDLLMWLSPPVLLTLVYVLLMSRGKSLGARLRKS